MNIWFLRMDKDGWKEFDLNPQNKYIYSVHGSCSHLKLALEYKDKLFPQLLLSGKELTELVRSIKEKLIASGKIGENELGKRRCDLAIRYWISIMKIGDIVFVRNKQNKVFLCKITGYISEDFFKTHGCFQRPVEIIQELTESMVAKEIWSRTHGRKTIERNAKTNISNWVIKHFPQ